MRLTEQRVIAKTKQGDLSMIKNFNCWGSDLTDVSVLAKLVNAEVINLTVNDVVTLAPFQQLKKLRVLYMRKNKIANVQELDYLQHLPELRELIISDNPFCGKAGDEYRHKVIKALPQITKLDGVEISEAERLEAGELRDSSIKSAFHRKPDGPPSSVSQELSQELQLNKRQECPYMQEDRTYSNLGHQERPRQGQSSYSRLTCRDSRDVVENDAGKFSESGISQPRCNMSDTQPRRECFSSHYEIGRRHVQENDNRASTCSGYMRPISTHSPTCRHGLGNGIRSQSSGSNLLSAAVGITQELDEDSLHILRGVIDSYIEDISGLYIQ